MALEKFHVLQDALVMRVGQGKDDVQRFLHGEILELDADADKTKALIKARAIGSKPRAEALTVAQVVPAYGAQDDPVAAPLQSVQPLNETAPATPVQEPAAGPAPVVPETVNTP